MNISREKGAKKRKKREANAQMNGMREESQRVNEILTKMKQLQKTSIVELLLHSTLASLSPLHCAWPQFGTFLVQFTLVQFLLLFWSSTHTSL